MTKRAGVLALAGAFILVVGLALGQVIVDHIYGIDDVVEGTFISVQNGQSSDIAETCLVSKLSVAGLVDPNAPWEELECKPATAGEKTSFEFSRAVVVGEERVYKAYHKDDAGNTGPLSPNRLEFDGIRPDAPTMGEITIPATEDPPSAS